MLHASGSTKLDSRIMSPEGTDVRGACFRLVLAGFDISPDATVANKKLTHD